MDCHLIESKDINNAFTDFILIRFDIFSIAGPKLVLFNVIRTDASKYHELLSVVKAFFFIMGLFCNKGYKFSKSSFVINSKLLLLFVVF
jgi:hypothetical protein